MKRFCPDNLRETDETRSCFYMRQRETNPKKVNICSANFGKARSALSDKWPRAVWQKMQKWKNRRHCYNQETSSVTCQLPTSAKQGAKCWCRCTLCNIFCFESHRSRVKQADKFRLTSRGKTNSLGSDIITGRIRFTQLEVCARRGAEVGWSLAELSPRSRDSAKVRDSNQDLQNKTKR